MEYSQSCNLCQPPPDLQEFSSKVFALGFHRPGTSPHVGNRPVRLGASFWLALQTHF